MMHCNTSSVNLGVPVIRHAAVFVVVGGVGELQKHQKKDSVSPLVRRGKGTWCSGAEANDGV